MIAFEVCPKCGGALEHFVYTINPPISACRCKKCGWEFKDQSDRRVATATINIRPARKFLLTCGYCELRHCMCSASPILNAEGVLGSDSISAKDYTQGHITTASCGTT